MNHCTAGTGTHNTPSFVKFENSLIQSVSAIYCCSRDLVISSFSNFFSLLDFPIGFIQIPETSLAVALTQKLSEAKRTRWSTPSSMPVAWATRLVDKLPWSLVWMTSFGRWRICVFHGRTLLEPVSKHWSLDRDLGIQGWMDGERLHLLLAREVDGMFTSLTWGRISMRVFLQFYFAMAFENSLSCVLSHVIQLPPMLQRDEALQPAVAVLRNATWPRIAVLICPLWRERNPWIQKQVWRSFCESLVTWLVTTASTHHRDATFIAWLGCVQHDFSGYLPWSNFRNLIWPTVSGVWCSIV